MADIQLTTIASLLYEMRGPMQSLYPTRNFLMAAWSGVGQDGAPGRVTPLEDREAFNGSKVRVPLDLGLLEGSGFVAEGGTVNVPIAPVFTHGTINLFKQITPFGISLESMEDSEGPNAVVSALATGMKKAREAMADRANLVMCTGGATPGGASGGLVASVASGSNLTWVLETDVDHDRIYAGAVFDVLTESNGANAGNGKRRKVASYTPSTRTVVFDTAAVASDGDSGNITASSSSGLYLPGSYGNVMAGGLESAKHATTFETVVRATYPQFDAVDGRAGTSTTQPFSDSMIDLGVTQGQRATNGEWDFGVGDPNAINVYKNAKQNQVRYTVATGKVAGRFSGVQIDVGGREITLVPERKLKPGSINLLARSAATIYGRKKGPDFDDITGSPFKQLARTTDYEVWLIDRWVWGWHDPSQITYFENLSTQSTLG